MRRTLLFLILPLLFLTHTSQAQVVPTTMWNDVANTDWYNRLDTEFTLSTAEDFAGLSVLVAGGNDFSGKTVFIAEDLNLGEHLWSPIGVDHNIPFSGSVDGGGHTLSNLFLDMPAGDYVGLFGQCQTCTVSNINLSEVYLRALDTAGSLAGNFSTNSTMSDCHATGVDIVATSYNIGGLVGGLITNSSVTRCSAQGSVVGVNQVGGLVGSPWDLTFITESFATGTVSAQHLAGGLIGYSTFAFGPNRENTINNCYSRSTVSVVNGRAGGLCGGSDGGLVMNNSYSTGTATGPEYAGGFIGAVGSVTIANSYWDTELSEHENAVGGWTEPEVSLDVTGKTTAEMKTAEMVSDLNQSQNPAPWTIDPDKNDGYPILDHTLVSTPSIEMPSVTVSVYPTIFNEHIRVESDSKLMGYTLNDISGRVIQQDIITGKSTNIDASSVSPGTYVLLIDTDGGRATKKVVKE